MRDTDGSQHEQIVERLTGIHHLIRRGTLATSRQIEGSPVGNHPEAEQAVQELREQFDGQSSRLEQRLRALGSGRAPAPSSEVEGPPEQAARASQAIEGDSDLLQRLSLAYQELSSLASALGDHETVSLADQGLQETQYLIRERISRIRPRVAAVDQATQGRPPPGVAE